MLDRIFDRIVSTAAANVPESKVHEGDYIGEDGFVYCGACHTQKQTRVSILGQERVVPIMCECAQRKYDAELAERKAEEERRRIAAMRRTCFPTEDMAHDTFAADDQSNARISAAMRRYVEKWDEIRLENMGLLLYGPVGTGKTFYAACIANALLDRGVPVMMTSFARVVNTMQGMYTGRQEYLDKLVSYPLLIIDDLGAERGSDYMLEQVYSVVDARYQTGRPLIVTTNIPISEIKEPQDLKYRRIYDRILERCHPVEITGPSRRRESVKANFVARKNLLGL